MTYFSHQLLVVSSAAAASTFYVEHCGLEILHTRSRDNGQVVHWVGRPGFDARMILVEGPAAEVAVGPYGHVGLSCLSREEYDGLLARATERGMVLEGPRSQPWPICDWFGMRDPDGNRVEISHGQDSWRGQ